jgi:hypothetical protein
MEVTILEVEQIILVTLIEQLLQHGHILIMEQPKQLLNLLLNRAI